MQENGYYWVRVGPEWIIAQLFGLISSSWYVCGNTNEIFPEEIGENVERKDNAIDYKELLKKYIVNVCLQEGIDFIPGIGHISDEENEELAKLSAQAFIDYPE